MRALGIKLSSALIFLAKERDESLERFEIDVKIRSMIVLEAARGSHHSGDGSIQIMECPYCGKKEAFVVKSSINESSPITYHCKHCNADGILDVLTLYHLGISNDNVFERYPTYKRDLQEFAYLYMDHTMLRDRSTIYWLHQCVDTEDAIIDTIDESKSIIEELNDELDKLVYNPFTMLLYAAAAILPGIIMMVLFQAPWACIPTATGCGIVLYYGILWTRRKLYTSKHRPLIKRAIRIYDDAVMRLISFRMSKIPKDSLSNISPFFHNRDDVERILELFLTDKAHTLMEAYAQIPTVHGLNPKDSIDSFALHGYESKKLLEDSNYWIQTLMKKCKEFDGKGWAS